MRVLELFSGTASFATVARERGHDTFTIDIDAAFKPDMVADIATLERQDLPIAWRSPDIVWASPPCQCFSVAAISKNWELDLFDNLKPIRQKTVEAMKLVEHTFKLIKALEPRWFFIENPRGMLRKMPFVRGWHYSTVTYCRYGFNYQKATNLWNNCFEWRPRPVCSPSSPCQLSALTGSHPESIGGDFWTCRDKRPIVPRELCEEILIACEGSGLGVGITRSEIKNGVLLNDTQESPARSRHGKIPVTKEVLR